MVRFCESLQDCCIVDKSTFYHNSSNNIGGSAIRIYSDDLIISNSIINFNVNTPAVLINSNELQLFHTAFSQNSHGDVIGQSPLNFGEITTTNFNGDSCDIYNNIFLDPMFVDPEQGNFHLQWGSPCIDAGDPLSSYDPDSTIADIGAYYFDQILGAEFPETCPLPTAFSLSLPYPNPFNSSVTISFAVPRPGEVRITIYDITGREVEALVTGHLSTGAHEAVWNAAGAASGVYFVRMEAGDFMQTRKMILLK